MVEDERRDALLGEALGERFKPVASRSRQAMRHHDDRIQRGLACGGVKPGGAMVLARCEGQILSFHARSAMRRGKT